VKILPALFLLRIGFGRGGSPEPPEASEVNRPYLSCVGANYGEHRYTAQPARNARNITGADTNPPAQPFGRTAEYL